jgi:hypothetical protein
MKGRAWILGGLVAVVIVLGVLGVTSTQDSERANASTHPGPGSATPAAKSSSEAVLAIAAGVRRTAVPSQTQSRMTLLMTEFVNAHDDKAIYERLKKLANPSAEELYVMAAILERCADVTDRKWRTSQRWHLGGDDAKKRFEASLSPKVPDRDKRIKAFEAINYDECAGFDGVKVTEKEVRAIHERAAAAGDPKSRAAVLRYQFDDQRRDAKGEVDWSKPAEISDAQIREWKDIVQSGDPRAVMDAISVIWGVGTSAHLRDPREQPIDMGSINLAGMLVACDLGRDCGPDSRYLLQGCAMDGHCDASDLRDYLFFYNAAPGSSQRVDEYRARLLDVINRGDWSFFTFTRGPMPAMAGYDRTSRGSP